MKISNINPNVPAQEHSSRLAPGAGAYRFPVEPGDRITATIWAECLKTKRTSEIATIGLEVPVAPKDLPPLLKPPANLKIVIE